MAGWRCYWRGRMAWEDGVATMAMLLAWQDGDAVGDAIGVGGQHGDDSMAGWRGRTAWQDGDVSRGRTATRTLNSIALLTTLCT